MAILSFLMQLAGATMLLLFAVRMVRTGIERAFGPAFRRWVTTEGHRLRSAGLDCEESRTPSAPLRLGLLHGSGRGGGKVARLESATPSIRTAIHKCV